ncbi:hypothetical protein J2T55_000253 [Methylohalomonas lacus]|uniref:DUF721 domain-containing protein n=1 Tax=Methylohalomonas lacus TaxID=398773 RepID=A0AAE3L0W4_9GAMM|nr:DUF721 domain-containing protein [Methylohalomonas lacus]MCS3902261.1 hypothetical protein [Methylohalomonas lacus]
MSNQNLSALLRRNPQVQRIVSHAKTLQRLQAQLEKHLPPALAENCQVAACADGVLTLYTKSPAWAAKLRFQTAALLKIFQDDTTLGAIDTIRVKARPPANNSPDALTEHRSQGLSDATSALLRQVAESTDDPDLRQTLLRLAEN